MGKRVRRLADLPEWFDLAKYKSAAALNATGWCQQLTVRASLMAWLDDFTRNDVQGLNALHEHAITWIRSAPIVVKWPDESLRAYFGSGDSLDALGVRLLTAHDFYLIEATIDQDLRDYARGYCAHVFENAPLIHNPQEHTGREKFLHPVDRHRRFAQSTATIGVNMAMPDELLISQFKEMLADMRKHAHQMSLPSASRRRRDFMKWVRHGLLPYLDLKLWEKQVGVSIPNSVMANAIFPPGEGGEEVVRKTTAKLAQEVLMPQHLEFLKALAAQERVELSRR